MPEQPPKLAGGARPRSALVAATAATNRARVTLAPPDDGEVLSLWASVSGPAVTLDVDAPEVAAGWAVSARGFAGVVKEVAGRVLTCEVSP